MRTTRAVALVVMSLVLAACAGGPRGASGGPSHSASPRGTTPSAMPSPVTTPSATMSPSGSQPWGPTEAELTAARTDVARLSVRELAGQLVVARYRGNEMTSAAQAVERLHLGGVIVFDENVPSDVVGGLRSSAAAVQRAMVSEGRDWPAIIAVDQEGGPVTRIGEPATAFTGAMALGAIDGRGAATGRALSERVGEASGEELRALGFTMVFAPDADVTAGPSDPTIGIRSPGSIPATVTQVATALVDGYRRAGIVPVAKHFPGHGSVTANSHLTLPVQEASLSALRARDFVPFQALVKYGAPAIMVTHIDVRAVDPGVPSSLSRQVVTGQLRDALGFGGLVVTDALDMAAVTQHYGDGRAAVMALQAGADVLLMPPDPAAAIDAVVDAVEGGTLSRSRLEDSAARIVALMRDVAAHPMPVRSVIGSHLALARSVASSSLTMVSGPCSGRLVGPSIRLVGGTSTDRARFTDAARAVGLRIGSGTEVRLLSTADSQGSGAVVVALDAPYGLADSPATAARIAAYGRTPAVFDSLVKVLTGTATALGRLPVKVGSYPIGTGCPR